MEGWFLPPQLGIVLTNGAAASSRGVMEAQALLDADDRIGPSADAGADESYGDISLVGAGAQTVHAPGSEPSASINLHR